MKPKFILTVDTEWDRKPSPKTVSIENISRLKNFQDLCANFNVKPTYLCSYEVITSRLFADFLKQSVSDEYEIGAHLHPWTTPPFTPIDRIEKKPYPTEFSEEIFCEKLENLTKEIEKRDKQPLSYRGGRFGFDHEKQARILLDLGYKIDCSVTPGINWQEVKGFSAGGPDFSGYPENCFYISREGRIVKERLEEGILEVPVTIFREGENYTWLRPLPHTVSMFKIKYKVLKIAKIRNLCDLAINKGSRKVLHMFIHSNELHEDCNPYFTTPWAVARLLKFFKNFFNYLDKNEIESISLSDFYDLEKCENTAGRYE